ncbi:hypothetical protein [Desulfosporosinus sp. FKA]|uniref:hypothetical protein n=1 Tax=Desulfosporosinus sp. FKA TaxID=1969834 RepID=UPI000B49D810|nr:hypothetical protein [Desulfosporosinus sp. FKA]
MYRINKIHQLPQILDMPNEVQQVITETVLILETEYGPHLANNGFGGFVVVLSSKEDLPSLQQLLSEFFIDLEKVIPEYVESVVCSDGQIFTNTLILCGSDFSIVIISPLSITHEKLKEYM